jgi:hypothetical protein
LEEVPEASVEVVADHAEQLDLVVWLAVLVVLLGWLDSLLVHGGADAGYYVADYVASCDRRSAIQVKDVYGLALVEAEAGIV